MAQESVIGSYMIRIVRSAGATRVLLHDLREGGSLEFETWVAAWAYLDERMHEHGTPDPGSPDPRT